MNLSLTKIVSSRSRRGGVSLHRNLLVASVLFRARDVYAAEMAGLVVIRNGSVYDRDSSDETPKVQDQSSYDDHETDDHVIPDDRIPEIVNAVVVNPISSNNNNNPSLNNESSETVDCDADLDREKENMKPLDSNAVVVDCAQSKPSKRYRKLPSKQCRKRKYTEVEQAVLSITEQAESGILPKKPCAEEETISLNCTELSSSLPEWSINQTSVTDNHFQSTVQSTNYHSESSLNAYSSRSYNNNDDDDHDDESNYHDISSSYQSSCHRVDSCNSPSDSISFSLSHSVLVVSV